MLALPRGLPQSDREWMAYAPFELNHAQVAEEYVQYAHLTPETHSNSAVIMVGGIPRDPERQRSLPVINKLYGSIALLAADKGVHSLIYQQVGTGGSTGNVAGETIQKRVAQLVEFTKHVITKLEIGRLSLVGMSLGSYIAARSVERIKEAGIKVNHLVLQSPAAYPEHAEWLPYGAGFTEAVRKPWDFTLSPVFSDISSYLGNGGSVLISYFQIDNPPIPRGVQDAYHELANKEMGLGKNITSYSITGVEHNFRKLKSNPNGSIIDNGSVKSVACTIASAIQ